MTMRLQHEWTPEHLGTAVELWRRLLDVYAVNAYEQHEMASGSHYLTYVADKDITDEWITALVISDGERVEFPADHEGYHGFYSAVELSLISYSDGGGSDLDAANVRALDGTPGVTVSTDGPMGEGSAIMMLGELPTNGAGDDMDTHLGWLRHVVEIMEGLEQHALINDETHDKYITELADDAWDQYLRLDVQGAVIDLLGDDDAAQDAYEAAEETAVKDAFYGYRHPSGEGWQAEGATSVRHVHYDQAIRHVAKIVFKRTDVDANCEACLYHEH